MAQEGDPADLWLEHYRGQTRKLYRSALHSFLTSVYGGGDLSSLASRYVQECREGRRDIMRDLDGFASRLSKMTPLSARTYMSAITGWLEYSFPGFTMNRRARLLRARLPRDTRPRTMEGELTREVLAKIMAASDMRTRVLISFLVSTGLRVSEATQLRISDLDLSRDPAVVRVRGEYTKTGNPRITFLTSEAKLLLQAWLRIREDRLRVACTRGRGLGIQKRPEDDRIFPFSPCVAQRMWQATLKRAGLDARDPSTGRHRYRLHLLRKYYNSALKAGGVPEDVVEAMMGHVGYLDLSYRRYTEGQLAEFYRKAEAALLINVPPEIAQGQHEIKGEMQALQNLVLRLTAENEMLKQKLASIETLESRLEELERRLGLAAQTLTSLRAAGQSEQVQVPG